MLNEFLSTANHDRIKAREKFQRTECADRKTPEPGLSKRAVKSSGFMVTVKENRLMLALLLLFAFGILYGAFLAGTSTPETMDALEFITRGYIGSRANQPLTATFASSVVSSGSLLILLYLLGFFAIAHPVSILVPVFRGLGIGLSMGYMYSYYGISGFLFCLALVLPNAVFSVLILIIACAQSIRFSNIFLSILIPEAKICISPKILQTYCIRFLILLCAGLGVSILDTACVAVFARFFSGMS
ncbi:MAG: stage II sporulation protein M [Oscillospiraceae bacterium]|nr:stage II sporulation protein M [Oscillospiraceae bacterium]